MFVAPEEIERWNTDEQGIVTHIAHNDNLAEPRPRTHMVEHQGRLAPEEYLFPTGKDMIEVQEDAIQFVGVGIPPPEQ